MLALCAWQERRDPGRGWRQEGRQDRRVLGLRGRLRRESEPSRLSLQAAEGERGIRARENISQFSESGVELGGCPRRLGLAVLGVPRARELLLSRRGSITSSFGLLLAAGLGGDGAQGLFRDGVLRATLAAAKLERARPSR